ncbi:MAG TPA: sigma 54-interacting transcriptional regulator, partial [Symbiobacteriaceae bacterium]|nr:sigma 54-interacting transcriptional regulator [Symbiobacteriaceae bacterium]
GARRGGRAGLFEMADGGTLFLDEIGDMDIAMQAKLLRALQGGEFRRLGGGAVRKADVRIISATNRGLSGLVEAKQFREDLYYRLRVVRILLPPLRERREDLPRFIEHGMKRACERLGRGPVSIEPGALRQLLAYQYPGNVRELENLLEQAVVLDDDGLITEADLPPEVAPRNAGATLGLLKTTPGGFPGWDEVEKALLEAGLRYFPSKAALAEHLGIGRATLYRKLAKYGLE